MPNITQYDAPIEGFKPSDKGSNAFAELAHTARVYGQAKAEAIRQTGQAINQGIHDLGRGVADMEQKAKDANDLQELSKLNKDVSELQWNQRQEYNEAARTLDSNDVQAWKDFADKQNDAWEGLRSGLKGKKALQHFETLRSHQRTHNLNTFAADQATKLVGEIERDRQMSYMALTANLSNDPSPANVTAMIEQQRMKDQAIYDAAQIPPSQQEKLRQHDFQLQNKILTETAAAYIRKSDNPEEAMRYIQEEQKNNPFYGRVDLIKLQQYSEAEAKRREATAQTAERRVEHNARVQIDSAQSKILLDSIQEDGKVVVPEGALDTFKAIFDQNPDLIKYAKPSEIKSFIDNIRHIANNPDDYNLTPNQDKMKAITLGIAQGTMTIPEILQARRDGLIGNQFMKSSIAEIRQFNGAMRTPEFNAALKAAERDLVATTFKGLPITDKIGKANYNNFMQSFMPQYRKAFAEGTLEPNALDTRDPESMISKAMGPFKRSMKDEMRDMQEALGGTQKTTPATPAIQGLAPNATPQQAVTAIASQYTGLNETAHRAILNGFFTSAGVRADAATTPWCAAFVNSVLAQGGFSGTGSLAAKSFLRYGTDSARDPQKGDIVVLNRTNDPSKGHVGFLDRIEGDTVYILGGNQGPRGSVSVQAFPIDRVAGIRRVTPDAAKQYSQAAPIQQRGTVEEPQALRSIPGKLYQNPATGQWYHPDTKTFYNADGTPVGPQVPRN